MMPNYELMLETFYKSILKKGDIAIDIGAHTGRHSICIADSVCTTQGKSGALHAFEPLPNAYKLLKKNIEEKCISKSQIHTYPYALGEFSGKTEFVVVTDFPEYSGFKTRQYHTENLRKEVIQVEVRTLDELAKDFGKIRYIKVDAEGGELTILRGATSLIQNCRPIITFELGDASLINYDYKAEDYFQFFASRNYNIYSIFGLPLTQRDFIRFSSEQFFWDYIAVPMEEQVHFSHDQIKIILSQLSEAWLEVNHLKSSIKTEVHPKVTIPQILKKIQKRVLQNFSS